MTRRALPAALIIAAGLLAVLLAGCGPGPGAAALSPAPPSSAPPVDGAMLSRWWAWRLSGPADPAAPRAQACAADPGSAVWFLDGPSQPGAQRRTCQVPAGRPLLAVPASLVGARPGACSAVLPTMKAEALVDGVTSRTFALGPVPASASVGTKDDQPELCGRVAVLGPLPAGVHDIVLRSVVGVEPAELTITVTAGEPR